MLQQLKKYNMNKNRSIEIQTNFIEENLPNLSTWFDSLSDKEKFYVIERMLKTTTPRLQQVDMNVQSKPLFDFEDLYYDKIK